jgi:rubrerythrin
VLGWEDYSQHIKGVNLKAILVKKAEVLWRCLSCGKLYARPDNKGATCPKCKPPSKVSKVHEE